MPKALPLDCHFVRFILSRSDLFLTRYASLTQVGAWRRRIEQEYLPHWQELEFHGPEGLSEQIAAFVALTFGPGRLPMLRRRYATERHRRAKLTKTVELEVDAINQLEQIKAEQALSSYSEAIAWLCQRASKPG
ncbi:hypothetical protein [Ferrimonas gelatinilytica]|uniref:Uncharacterized protein n=1 Tax=Ferrimonas gelatinilytica TaxID=1255257 RepID=A0ABP9RXM0_9GAMM